MKRQFRSGQNQQQQANLGESQIREFANPEGLLRHDADHTPVPPTVAYRLQESINKLPPQPRPWWRRLLGS